MTPRKRRITIAIVILVLLPVLVPLITLPRAKAGILDALQAGLGRRVEAQAVHLQLFPRPGVELDQVRLADDPAFGLEDMVMADSASAAISLWALFRGRIVFSRLHLQDPSINLVRNRAGRWNIVALLSPPPGGARAAASTAPHPHLTAFPYLDWSDARINFKFDQTKTHFYLDQVQGSLDREPTGWRLHLSFVPARSDLNLSNTGVVTLDGLWQPPASSSARETFDLAVHLRDSYLAGSSALLFGHDAGVHGILNAALRVHGTNARFAISGTATARSLRRWDLLPPPATIRSTFAAVYTPAQDRLELQGLGDPGWNEVRLSGLIENLFSQPRADLHLQVNDLPASQLLPLVLALKANLPSDLAAQGTLNGAADLRWKGRELLPAGRAAFHFAHLRLSGAGATLSLPSAALDWNGSRLQLPAAVASLSAAGRSTDLRVSGGLDPRGFSLALRSPAFTAQDSAALARLLGLSSPWPAALRGTARLQLRLAAPWSQLTQAQWRGEASFAQARFQPPASAGLELRALRVALNGSDQLSANFTLAALPLQGSLTRSSASPLRFALRGGHFASDAFWALLHPAPGDLMQRMFGAVLGSAPAPPAWLSDLRAEGAVHLEQIRWHGIPASLSLSLDASPGAWRADPVRLQLAGGAFEGRGRLVSGHFDIRGSIPSAHPLHLLPLLAPTPYAGLLQGQLTGSLQLLWPLSGGDWRHMQASGSFLLRDGLLRTSRGPWRFRSCRGSYALRNGRTSLTPLSCLTDARRYTGSGTAVFTPSGPLTYSIRLTSGPHSLHLSSTP